LPLSFAFLASCRNAPSNTPVEPEKPTLDAPVLTVDSEAKKINWIANENASGYSVKLDNADPVTITETSLDLSKVAGDHNVSVVALAKEGYKDSAAAQFDYETINTLINGLEINVDNVITWTDFSGAGLEVKKDNGEYTLVETESYTPTENGKYTFHAMEGYFEDLKKYYAEADATAATKSIDVVLRTKLSAPELEIETDGKAISWEAITGATNYVVTVNNGDPVQVTETSFDLPEEIGEYTIKVQAIADVAKYNSDEASISYSVKKLELELSRNEAEVTIVDYAGLKVNVSVNNDAGVEVGENYICQQSGTYTFFAVGGFDGDHTYYVQDDEDPAIVSFVYVKQATDSIALEDGTAESNADLADKYVVQKYGENGWQESTASIVLDTANEGYSEGKGVKLNFWRHSAWFKYNTPFSAAYAYDTISFFAKSKDQNKFIVSFEISTDKYLGQRNLKGTYITYQIDAVSTAWKQYVVSLSDENWKIDFGNGTKYNFTQVKAMLDQLGYSFNSLAEFMPFFDSYQLRVYKDADSSYSSTYMYLDDLILSNTHKESEQIDIIKLNDNYALKSDSVTGSLALNEAKDGGVLKLTVGGNTQTLDVSVSILNGRLRIQKDIDTNQRIDALFNSADNGFSFTLHSCERTTQALQALFTNARLETYQVFDNFESYSGTGVGYDQKNKSEDTRSGLRGNYYCDYYSGGSGSVVGGNGWSLMGSTDYLDLNTAAENVHSGSKSARFKYNASNQMRFLNWGLYTGEKPVFAQGATTLSLWVKGVATRANVLKIRAFTQKITAATQGSPDKEIQVTVSQGSDWMEVKLTLDPTKVYYGFVMLPIKGNGTGQYFYVDDITVYGSISPWGN
jgi:hypothetical protein